MIWRTHKVITQASVRYLVTAISSERREIQQEEEDLAFPKAFIYNDLAVI
jgi:hypothetical protein